MFIFLQKLLPKKTLSFSLGVLSRLALGPVTNLMIRLYIYVYGVDMSDAKIKTLSGYRTFNEFFTRELTNNARPQPIDKKKISSPVDGTISQCGHIKLKMLLQAKGSNYSLKDLLGDDQLVELFTNGTYHTIYLAPHNYHRIHMPSDGSACFLHYYPGQLFSVNKKTVEGINNLFCINERASIVYKSDTGYFAIVMVGALNVGSIEINTHFKQQFTNRPTTSLSAHASHRLKGEKISRGTELGRFNMGSTVIFLTSKNFASWDDFDSDNTSTCVGAELGGTLL